MDISDRLLYITWIAYAYLSTSICNAVYTHTCTQSHIHRVSSSWPSDAIWRQRYGSTSVQVMACCLMAPTHYLNQCWLTMNKVLWHSYEGIIIRRSEDTNHKTRLKFAFLRSQPHLLGINELSCMLYFRATLPEKITHLLSTKSVNVKLLV